jgi:hypothetical protein
MLETGEGVQDRKTRHSCGKKSIMLVGMIRASLRFSAKQIHGTIHFDINLMPSFAVIYPL